MAAAAGEPEEQDISTSYGAPLEKADGAAADDAIIEEGRYLLRYEGGEDQLAAIGREIKSSGGHYAYSSVRLGPLNLLTGADARWAASGARSSSSWWVAARLSFRLLLRV